MKYRPFLLCLGAALCVAACAMFASFGPMVEPPGLFRSIEAVPEILRNGALLFAAGFAAIFLAIGMTRIAALVAYQIVATVRFLAFRRQITDTTATSGRVRRILNPIPS